MATGMSSDETLMLEFQGGSRAAFEELFARYSGPLYGYFLRRLGNAQRAEELAQETFLAVIRGAGRYEPRALVKTYLYGIAVRLLAAERRKQRRDPVKEEASEPAASATQEDALWVREALAKLDDIERELIMLREYEQLSYGEIATVMRAPVNTVRSRLFRARMAMRSHLQPRHTAPAHTPANPVEGEA